MPTGIPLADRASGRGDGRLAGRVLQRGEGHPVHQSVDDLAVVRRRVQVTDPRGPRPAWGQQDVIVLVEPGRGLAQPPQPGHRQRNPVQIAGGVPIQPSVRLSSRLRSKLEPNISLPVRTSDIASDAQYSRKSSAKESRIGGASSCSTRCPSSSSRAAVASVWSCMAGLDSRLTERVTTATRRRSEPGPVTAPTGARERLRQIARPPGRTPRYHGPSGSGRRR